MHVPKTLVALVGLIPAAVMAQEGPAIKLSDDVFACQHHDVAVTAGWSAYALTFNGPLKFSRLVENPNLASWICTFAGRIFEHALLIDGPAPLRIERFNPPGSVHEPTTVIITAPVNKAKELNDQLRDKDSRLYNHPDLNVEGLANMIDHRFIIQPLDEYEGDY